MDRIEDQKGQEYFGVKELADAAERVLAADGRMQEKGTVANYPNERTIRFYIGRGLLPPANDRRGSALVFGYHHLLALIAIKRLQADGMPINIIGQIIAGKSEAELEELIKGPATAASREQPPATQLSQPLFSKMSDFAEPSKAMPAPAAPSRNRAKEYLEGLLASRTPEPPPDTFYTPAAGYVPTQAAQSISEPPKPAAWHREEIAPGLELHIREDFKKPSGFREMSRLIAAIKQVLRR